MFPLLGRFLVRAAIGFLLGCAIGVLFLAVFWDDLPLKTRAELESFFLRRGFRDPGLRSIIIGALALLSGGVSAILCGFLGWVRFARETRTWVLGALVGGVVGAAVSWILAAVMARYSPNPSEKELAFLVHQLVPLGIIAGAFLGTIGALMRERLLKRSASRDSPPARG